MRDKAVSKLFFPKDGGISRLYVLFEYDDEVRSLIEQLKYEKRKEIAHYMISFCRFVHSNYDCIVPVPLHPVRYRERGFNQSLVIARELSRHTGIPVVKSGIIRKRYTRHQTGLGKTERKKNLEGAFKVSMPERFQKKKIMLVDDVYTTGATLENLSKAFRGYPSVIDGFVLASKV